MEKLSLYDQLSKNAYPGRGIVIGRTADGAKAITAYFIMGRRENSRNRVFTEDGEGGSPHTGVRPFKAQRSKPYYLCACTCARQQDDRYERRPDGYSLRPHG